MLMGKHCEQDDMGVQVIYINCMSLKNSQAIFNRILGELTGSEVSRSMKQATKLLEKTLCEADEMM